MYFKIEVKQQRLTIIKLTIDINTVMLRYTFFFIRGYAFLAFTQQSAGISELRGIDVVLPALIHEVQIVLFVVRYQTPAVTLFVNKDLIELRPILKHKVVPQGVHILHKIILVLFPHLDRKPHHIIRDLLRHVGPLLNDLQTISIVPRLEKPDRIHEIVALGVLVEEEVGLLQRPAAENVPPLHL
jgi:hypothetical protein